MIFTDTYFFQGAARWNLLWPSPNYAGVFVVCALCFLWTVERRMNRTFLIVFGAELLLVFALGKTGSRGSLVALVGAIITYHIYCRRVYFPREISLWLTRVVTYVLILLNTNLFNRSLDYEFVAADKSILNRIEVWRGGFSLAEFEPFTGWGLGESGRAYMNWIQPNGFSEYYPSLVNGYLTVLVELGVFVLAIFLFLTVSLLLISWPKKIATDSIAVVPGACSCVMAWLIANIFTVLYRDPWLWVLPFIGSLILINRRTYVDGAFGFNIKTVFRVSGSLVALMTGIFFGLAWSKNDKRGFLLAKSSNGSIVFSTGAHPISRLRCFVVTDFFVCGEAPGRKLRSWAGSFSEGCDLTVAPLRPQTSDHIRAYDVGIFLGATVSRLSGIDAGFEAEFVNFLYPSLPPPMNLNVNRFCHILVTLSKHDEFGLNGSWQRWAKGRPVSVQYIDASNGNIQDIWSTYLPRKFDGG